MTGPTLRALALFTALAFPASAATFVVDDSGLAEDTSPGDGTCATASGTCTLEAALTEVEALPGADAIEIPPAMTASVPWRGVGFDITQNLRLYGGGIIDAAQPASDPLAVLPGATLTLESLTLRYAQFRAQGGTVVARDCTFPGTGYGPRIVAQDLGHARLDRCAISWGTVTVQPGGDAVLQDCTIGGQVLSVVGMLEVHGGTALVTGLRGTAQGDASGQFAAPLMRVTAGNLTVEDARVAVSLLPVLAIGGGTAVMERSMLRGATALELSLQAVTETPLIDATGGSLDVRHGELHGNWGGGIAVGAAADVTITHCLFASLDGCALDVAGRATVEDTVIRDCRSRFVTSNDYPSGTGGVAVQGGVVLMTRARIERNRADECHGRWPSEWGIGRGGGIAMTAGDVTLRDCTIESNAVTGGTGAFGGGIAVDGGTLRAERCSIVGNTCAGDGAGVAVTGGSVTLADCTVAGNAASLGFDENGSSDSASWITYGGHGGGVFASAGTVNLWSATIASNQSAVTGGLAAQGTALVTAGDSILADNGNDCAGPLRLAGYTLIENDGGCWPAGDLTGVITSVDPQLQSPASDAGAPPAMALAAGSIARDAAHPSGNRDGLGGVLGLDQRLRARIVDGNGDGAPRGDLGAFEACEDATDTDGDGLGDACDPCPLVGGRQSDADADGVGDACDTGDADGDGVIDSSDSCPSADDPSQGDADGDAIGDACDGCPALPDDGIDTDGDGIGDACDCTPSDFGPAPADGDGDGDAVPDPCDDCPLAADPLQGDTDGDGTGDACDDCPAAWDPAQYDRDGDGIGSACDNCHATANEDQLDGDADRLGDACDNCPAVSNVSQQDSDFDAIGDACDVLPNCAEPRDLRVGRVAGQAQLTWIAAGAEGDVYEGEIATLHAGYAMNPVACAVADGSTTLALPVADSYWLVGGRCGADRTGLGRDWLGNDIPLPANACP